MALSTDLMRTRRWQSLYKNLSEHKELNKTLLIRKVNNIIQVYGLHAHVQQIQTIMTKFVDVNRYETDVIETEQVSMITESSQIPMLPFQAHALYTLFKDEFDEMEKLDLFRETELHFIYHRRRALLLVQCFQDKFELVKARVQIIRSQLSTLVLPVKSPALSRYYSKSNELQRIAGMSMRSLVWDSIRVLLPI